jgi:GT2 family glycosyltransferase
MSVYAGENPAYFARCTESIVKQSVLPNEWIIVKDGPLTEGLEHILDNLHFPGTLKIIALPKNVTQGPARAKGVKSAKHEWIAIMDSDDICRLNRFEKQIAMIHENPSLSLIGGQINEFTDDPKKAVASRAVPVSHKGICIFAKKRNPFNSMTVMMRKKTAVNAGNYRYFPCFEDYDLWARMIKKGAICANCPDVLVDARVGAGMYRRRRGLVYMALEWKMQKTLRRLGIINGCDFLRNVCVRIPFRILPEKCIALIYNIFAR